MVLDGFSVGLDSVVSKWFKNEKMKAIVIHGPSSSGKSTLCSELVNVLEENGIVTFSIVLDSYYKTCPYEEGQLKSYDFDNPAALDWEKIHMTLKAIDKEDEMIPIYTYSFITRKSEGPIWIKNRLKDVSNNKRVVLIEGLYAMNLMSTQIFDMKHFNPTLISQQPFFCTNPIVYKNLFPLNIRLSLCKDSLFAIRKARDVILRGKTLEIIEHQFHNQVWPATKKFVNHNNFIEDIRLSHGTFNRKRFEEICTKITNEFCINKIKLRAPPSQIKLSCGEECELSEPKS